MSVISLIVLVTCLRGLHMVFAQLRLAAALARGRREENTDRAKNQSDCRVRYLAL